MSTPRRQQSLLTGHETRFTALLVSLVVLLVLYPFARLGTFSMILLDICSAAVLLAGVYAVSSHRRQFRFAVGLAVMAAVMGLIHGVIGGGALLIPRNVTMLMFLALMTGLILRAVLLENQVTRDTILGAITVYLLAGLAWSEIHSLVELVSPGSYAFLQDPELTGLDLYRILGRRMIYYSFVTLTTLGYGDIVPVAPPARTLSWLEAFSGQLYLAVMVARVVGLQLSQGQRNDTT